MEHDQLDRMLDEWLDRASAERGKTEPRPGFEQRIMAGIHNRKARRSFPFGWKALATATAVAVVACVFLAHFADDRGKQNPLPGESSVPMRIDDVLPSQMETSVIVPPPVPRPARVLQSHEPESLPRQEVFPSLRLSQQDRLLLAYVRAVHSGTITGISEERQDGPVETGRMEEIPGIEISAIEIEPLIIERLP